MLTQEWPLQTTKYTKKPMPTERMDRAWYSQVLQHPVRKRSGSHNPESAQGSWLHLCNLQSCSCCWTCSGNCSINRI